MWYNNRIVLLQQYHIPEDKDRQLEIQETLKRNVESKLFFKIYLLNEREYTKEELGFPDGMPNIIQQIIIQKRLDYYTAFEIARRQIKDAWVVLSNNDIFYDSSLIHLFQVGQRKRIRRRQYSYTLIALGRWELGASKPFLYDHPHPMIRAMTQDSWMWYANETPHLTPETKVMLGVPGCDNRIAYVLKVLQKYNVINCPFTIKSYHNHASQKRYYTNADKIQGPYAFIQPKL